MPTDFAALFTAARLAEMFPPSRTNDFFDALYGDAEDGAYDIRLTFREATAKQLVFAFELHQRKGKCLACNLTYGLPQVFTRHPVINIKGVINSIASSLYPATDATPELAWRLGATEEHSRQLHSIPLLVSLPA